MGVDVPSDSDAESLSSVRERFSGVASLSRPEADSLGRFVGVQRVPWAVSVDDAPSRDELLNGESSLELGLNGDSCGAGVSGTGEGAEGGKDWLTLTLLLLLLLLLLMLLLLLLLLPEGAPEGGSGLNTEATEAVVPEPDRGFELHSSPGCFFWTSAKHLEQRFMVLLEPQNPHGQRGGRLGGLLRSLVSPMAALLLLLLLPTRGGGGGGEPVRKTRGFVRGLRLSALLCSDKRQTRPGLETKAGTGVKVHKMLESLGWDRAEKRHGGGKKSNKKPQRGVKNGRNN